MDCAVTHSGIFQHNFVKVVSFVQFAVKMKDGAFFFSEQLFIK